MKIFFETMDYGDIVGIGIQIGKWRKGFVIWKWKWWRRKC